MLAGVVLLALSVAARLPGGQILSRRAVPVLALIAATGYTALAGFSVATTRALVMLAAALIARGLGRRGRGANALLPALALILVDNPMAAVGSGLWLSFAAVASLLWLANWQGSSHPAAMALRAHLFLAMVMLPLGGVFFGGASLVSAPANLVAVPLFALWVVPVALLGVLFALLGSDAAAWCWQLAAAPVEFWLALTAESGHHYLAVRGGWASVALAVLGVASLAVPLSMWWRALALLLLLPLVVPAGPGDRAVRVTVLDVGQGTAVVVQQGTRALLYDTGGGDPTGANVARSVVLPYLRSRGVAALQDLVISHGDLDHAAGLGSVRASLPVARLWMGGVDDFPRTARACRSGQSWYWPGGPRFRFLSPGITDGLSDNDASCVLMVDTGRGRVLLAGDISQSQEFQVVSYWRDALAADVLLVGHHGSHSSTTQAWLNRVDPILAIHSAGYGNRFGHPHGLVRTRLAAQGVRQYTTWQLGALELAFPETASRHPEVQAARVKTWWK
jgi:competence protein ComEC